MYFNNGSVFFVKHLISSCVRYLVKTENGDSTSSYHYSAACVCNSGRAKKI